MKNFVTKLMMILTHVSGELALIALHQKKATKDYMIHIADELAEAAEMIRAKVK